jgi:Mg2+ and Co2+ transporter CorA
MKYDTRFDKIEQKVDNLDSKLDEITVVLVKQQSILDEHMARTKQVEDALLPIKEKQAQMAGAGKLITILATILSIVTVVYKYLLNK